jgi:hypothetical protein
VAEADGAGGSGGVYGEQGAILAGAELGWDQGPDLTGFQQQRGKGATAPFSV